MLLRQQAISNNAFRCGVSQAENGPARKSRTLTHVPSSVVSMLTFDTLPSSVRRTKPIFRFPIDANSDNEGDNQVLCDSPTGSPDVDDNSSEDDDPFQLERERDEIRRFHALMELLSTEVGYLDDLRVLVTVQLIPAVFRLYLTIWDRSTFVDSRRCPVVLHPVPLWLLVVPARLPQVLG